MTSRQAFNAVLIELNKVLAPNLLLEDFNYFFNKAINQYVNEQYNFYGADLLRLDNSRVLLSVTDLYPYKSPKISNDVTSFDSTNNTKYDFLLPADYVHLLGCKVWYYIRKNIDCHNAGTYEEYGAKRMSEDIDALVMRDFFMRPAPTRPYYYIHNENIRTTKPTNELRAIQTNFNRPGSNDTYMSARQRPNDVNNNGRRVPDNYSGSDFTEVGTDTRDDPSKSLTYDELQAAINTNDYINSNLTFPRILGSDDFVERTAGHRYGNSSVPVLTIVYGKDNSVFQLDHVRIAYLKAPQYIRLTQELIDLTEDTSQILEFPDYVCQEIVNKLVTLIMENSGDLVLAARMANNKAVSESIAPPAQQLAQQQSK